ncbi:hypothetical protein [Curvibacter fontanus]
MRNLQKKSRDVPEPARRLRAGGAQGRPGVLRARCWPMIGYWMDRGCCAAPVDVFFMHDNLPFSLNGCEALAMTHEGFNSVVFHSVWNSSGDWHE